MDDAPLVRGVERLADLQRHLQRLFGLQGTIPQSLGQRLPADELHDELFWGQQPAGFDFGLRLRQRRDPDGGVVRSRCSAHNGVP